MSSNNPVKIGLPLVCEDYYLIHGKVICIKANNPLINKTMKNLLYYFSHPEVDPANIDVTFFLYSTADFKEASSCLLPRSSKPNSFSGDMLYFLEGDFLITMVPHRAVVRSDFSRMEVIGVIHEKLVVDPWVVFQLFFSPAFLEMLKKLGLYSLHASTVCRENRGFFFSATTGSGKSTLAISLVRAGFSFLTDDITLVRRTGSHLELLAFPQPVQMWDDALERFPELHYVKSQFSPCQGYKKQFRVEDVYQGCLRERTVPKAVIFPKIVNQKESYLEELSKTKALVQLIPQSLIVAQRPIVRDHLDVLSDLVDRCHCYRLSFGSDIECIPDLISAVL